MTAPERERAALRYDEAGERLLGPTAVAALFGVFPKTVTRWANTGQLESVRVDGGHRKFRESAVLALLPGDRGTARQDGEGGGVPAEWPDLLTPAEVAAALGLHLATVARRAETGQLWCGHLPGGQRRFLKEEVELTAAGRCTEARQARERITAWLARGLT